jgi:hypothetical protein
MFVSLHPVFHTSGNLTGMFVYVFICSYLTRFFSGLGYIALNKVAISE